MWLAFIATVAGCGKDSIVAPPAAEETLVLVAPENRAIMDNGRRDRKDHVIWRFEWSGHSNATQYQLRVQRTGSSAITIDEPNLMGESYVYDRPGAYFIEAYRFDWRWSVRAMVNGEWGGWTTERSFDLEPADRDSAVTSQSSVTTADAD
jgi:hypothetical protein